MNTMTAWKLLAAVWAMREAYFLLNGNIWAVLGIALICYAGFQIYKANPLGKVMAARRERKRILRHAASLSIKSHDETESALFRRLGITREKGRKIGWDYLVWSSYPPYRRPHLGEFPRIPLKPGDREHLAEIFYCQK